MAAKAPKPRIIKMLPVSSSVDAPGLWNDLSGSGMILPQSPDVSMPNAPPLMNVPPLAGGPQPYGLPNMPPLRQGMSSVYPEQGGASSSDTYGLGFPNSDSDLAAREQSLSDQLSKVADIYNSLGNAPAPNTNYPAPQAPPVFTPPPMPTTEQDTSSNRDMLRMASFLPLLGLLTGAGADYGAQAFVPAATGLLSGNMQRQQQLSQDEMSRANAMNQQAQQQFENQGSYNTALSRNMTNANDANLSTWQQNAGLAEKKGATIQQGVLGQLKNIQDIRDQRTKMRDQASRNEVKAQAAALTSAMKAYENGMSPAIVQQLLDTAGIQNVTPDMMAQMPLKYQYLYNRLQQTDATRRYGIDTQASTQRSIAAMRDTREGQRINLQGEANQIRAIAANASMLRAQKYQPGGGKSANTFTNKMNVITKLMDRKGVYASKRVQILKQLAPDRITGEKLSDTDPNLASQLSGELDKINVLDSQVDQYIDQVKQIPDNITGPGSNAVTVTPQPNSGPAPASGVLNTVPHDRGFTTVGMHPAAVNSLANIVGTLSSKYALKLNSGFRTSSPLPGGGSTANTPHRQGVGVDLGLTGKDRTAARFTQLLSDVRQMPGVASAIYEDAGTVTGNGAQSTGPHIHINFSDTQAPQAPRRTASKATGTRNSGVPKGLTPEQAAIRAQIYKYMGAH